MPSSFTIRVMVPFVGAFFLSLISLSSFAWETDNFSCAQAEIEDSTEVIDEETNQRIQAAIETLNSQGGNYPTSRNQNFRPGQSLQRALLRIRTCDQREASKILANVLAPAWTGNLETWVQGNRTLSKCEPPSSGNVFSGFSLNDSPVARLAGLTPVIRIGNYRLGADKLAHFMTEGYEYWLASLRGANSREILQQGITEEEGGYGWSATGVKSYGDMAANYSGFMFWRNVFAGPNPMLSCQNGIWTQNRRFSWRDYVNASFDESINCNEWKTPGMLEIANNFIRTRLANSRRYDRRECPISTSDCLSIEGAYSSEPPIVIETIVHPSCLSIIRNNRSSVTNDGPLAPSNDNRNVR